MNQQLPSVLGSRTLLRAMKDWHRMKPVVFGKQRCYLPGCDTYLKNVKEMTMAASKKNILLVSLDDAIAYWNYKSAFNEPLQTPNLDRICETSTAFRSAYCQAPICGPSRASFMSAKTPHQLGIFDHEADVFDRIGATEMWGYQLKANGYFCSSGGKVHHRYKPVRRRFHNIIYSDQQKDFASDMHLPPDIGKKRFGGNRGGWSTTDEKDDSGYYDAKSADSAIDFLQNYDREEPFYREVGFYSPHGPHYTPVRFKEMYDVSNFRQPEAWKEGFKSNNFTDIHWPENEFIKNGDLNWWRDSVRNYYSAFSHGDFHLGRVWDALKASRHAQNTVVVILSDHGFHLGNRNRYMKTTLWEQVAGVPFIIHDPECSRAQIVKDPVALLDVGPTVLDYAGLPALTDCVGQSLRPYTTGYSEPDRVIPTFYRDSATIRKGDFRFIRYEDASTQIFDLANDYWQLHDLGTACPEYDAMYDALVECCRVYGFEVPGR